MYVQKIKEEIFAASKKYRMIGVIGRDRQRQIDGCWEMTKNANSFAIAVVVALYVGMDLGSIVHALRIQN